MTAALPRLAAHAPLASEIVFPNRFSLAAVNATQVASADAAAVTALATLAGLAVLAGASPLDALRALALGSLGSRAAIGETLLRSTGIVLTAAGACLALRAGVLNIGLEGQFLAGAAAAAPSATRRR